MTTPEEDDEIAKTVNALLGRAGDADSLRIALNAALRLFHSAGYRRGYGDAMEDVKAGRDRRVVARLN